MTTINQHRALTFPRKSMKELIAIAESGSLGAAAAKYEINRRTKK